MANTVEGIDTHPLERIYLRWQELLISSYNDAAGYGYGSWKGLVVGCGMGGSAFSLDAASIFLEDYGIPLVVVRCHQPPGYVSDSTLVSAVSYSGETAETIHCATKAMERGAPIAVVAGKDSRLARLARKWGAPLYEVRNNSVARASLAVLLGGVLGLLNSNIGDSVSAVAGALDPTKATRDADLVVESLLSWIRKNKKIVVASCGRLGMVALRWRAELAEYAGIDVQAEQYPEAGHNSVSTWTQKCLYNRGLILIRHSADPLCKAIEDLLEEKHCENNKVIVDVSAQAKVHPLAGLLQSAMTAGLAGIRLAERLGIDPVATPEIAMFRRMVLGVFDGRL